MSHRYYISIIFISIAAFLVLFIFFINIFQLPTANRQSSITNSSPQGGSLAGKQLPITQPVIDFTDPVLGEKTAVHTIAVYGDFQCPYSKQATPVLRELVKNYPKRVKLVWKDFPNTMSHPAGFLASQAAHCAKKQGKFWEYHDYLFENQKQISPSFLFSLADELKLDKHSFHLCLQNNETKTKVQNNLDEARALKLDGTPTIFINGTLYQGKITYENLEEMIK